MDKTGRLVTTSLTLIDIHDIARSAKTFGVSGVYVAHPSPALHKLANTLKSHWEEGFGATYNPNRKEAIEGVQMVNTLDEVIGEIESRTGVKPILVATSAKEGSERVSFESFRDELSRSSKSYLMMLGTGWGMAPELLARADMFLEPVRGPSDYNHLSVRSACAIMLARLFGR